jgi:glycosyltransferase involved in cell wall biosynthesis
VVATAVDGTPEVVIDGKTGITVPPGDPERLAEAIYRLLREPRLRERMAEAGHNFVVEHFSQERQIRQTQELYLSAWEQHQRGARPVLQKVGIRNEAHTAVPTAGHNR